MVLHSELLACVAGNGLVIEVTVGGGLLRPSLLVDPLNGLQSLTYRLSDVALQVGQVAVELAKLLLAAVGLALRLSLLLLGCNLRLGPLSGRSAMAMLVPALIGHLHSDHGMILVLRLLLLQLLLASLLKLLRL